MRVVKGLCMHTTQVYTIIIMITNKSRKRQCVSIDYHLLLATHPSVFFPGTVFSTVYLLIPMHFNTANLLFYWALQYSTSLYSRHTLTIVSYSMIQCILERGAFTEDRNTIVIRLTIKN